MSWKRPMSSFELYNITRTTKVVITILETGMGIYSIIACTVMV
jgi:hypothetical protein